jgi:ribosomal protein S27E
VSGKHARLIAVVVEVECPDCGAKQAEEVSGSFLWDLDTLRSTSSRDVDCRGCGYTFRLATHDGPRVAR